MYRILIVDDEPMLTELLADHLRDCGYAVMAANSAREAMALLPRNPDLIMYLLGVGRENFTTVLLLLTLCAVFAFGNCLSSEYQSGA